MTIIDIYSKKKTRQSGKQIDVFTYDSIPTPLRVQIVHIWQENLGVISIDDWLTIISPNRFSYGNSINPEVQRRYNCYIYLCKALCHEYGIFVLTDDPNPFDQLTNFFIHENDTDKILDVIQLSFRLIEQVSPDSASKKAIDELNYRFREHSVGYQYEAGEIIKLDTEFIHSEITRPAINLLSDLKFKGALDEFLRAHEHYRKGEREYKACLTECLQSFESCLKTICGLHKWKFDEKNTAKTLLGIVRQNDLIPAYLDSHYTSLWSMLESGVPKLRNKEGAHGQGEKIKTVPDYFAAFALHLTAASLLFFVKAHQNFGK